MKQICQWIKKVWTEQDKVPMYIYINKCECEWMNLSVSVCNDFFWLEMWQTNLTRVFWMISELLNTKLSLIHFLSSPENTKFHSPFSQTILSMWKKSENEIGKYNYLTIVLFYTGKNAKESTNQFPGEIADTFGWQKNETKEMIKKRNRKGDSNWNSKLSFVFQLLQISFDINRKIIKKKGKMQCRKVDFLFLSFFLH